MGPGLLNIESERLLNTKSGTYALVLHGLHPQSIVTGKLGKMNVGRGCYVYVGSAFGPGGVLARIKHHRRILKSFHWHIDYLMPAVQLTEVWFSYDPIKREHEWAGIFMRYQGVGLPLRGFGSSDCKCDSHLFSFNVQPTVAMFRKQIKQVISDHHPIEWIRRNAQPG